jgi:hypothetical protein
MIFSSVMRGCVPVSEGKAAVPSAPEGWTKYFQAHYILYSGLLRCGVTTVVSWRFAKTGYVGWEAD